MLLLTNKTRQVVNVPAKELQTTGSMEEGSPLLVCADASEFQIGDHVVVEIGGEAGQGLRDTVGVGGQFTSPRYDPDSTYFYDRAKMPRSLLAEIIGKEGNTLELDKNAVVATTDANVYFDNIYPWEALGYTEQGFYSGHSLHNRIIQFPPGKFTFSRSPNFGTTTDNADVLGSAAAQTEIHCPKGINSIYLDVGWGAKSRLARIVLRLNFLQHGYLEGTNVFGGLSFNQQDNPCMHDLLVINHPNGGVGFGGCQSGRAYRCNMFRDEPHITYMQWGIGDNHSDDSMFIECRFDSPNGCQPAFEPFRSTNTKYIRCGGINAIFSSGGSAGFLLDEFWSIITDGAGEFPERPFRNQTVFYVGDNVGATFIDKSVGGTIRNPRIIMEGYLNDDGHLMNAISAWSPGGSFAYANVTIEGTDYEKALISAPDHISSSSGSGASINSDNCPNLTVSGIRVVGYAGAIGNIRIPSDGSVIDCVADVIPGSPTQSGNQTNAAYLGVPEPFADIDWSVARGDQQAVVTISSLPADNGTTITDVEYRLNGSAWVSSGGTTNFTITGLTNGTTYGIQLRAVNANGGGHAGSGSIGRAKTVKPVSSGNETFADDVIDLLGAKLKGLWDFSDTDHLWKGALGRGAVTEDGDPIGRVDDLSGNGMHWIQQTGEYRTQFSGTQASYKPTWMSELGCARFDGESDWMSIRRPAFPVAGLEVFAVFEQHATGASDGGVFSLINDGSYWTNPGGVGLSISNSSNWFVSIAGSGLAPKAVWRYRRYESGGNRIAVAAKDNGIEVGAGSASGSWPETHNGDSFLGCFNGAAPFGPIDFYGLVVAVGLTTEERAGLLALLYGRYDITP